MDNKEPLSVFTIDEEYWYANACINVCHDNSMAYWNGYKMAGDIIVDEIIKSKKNQDYLIYPIVFLYRQHIELLLKDIIKTARDYLDKDARVDATHKLEPLWDIAKTLILESLNDDIGSINFELIEKTIKEFDMIDPKGMEFRYSISTTGEKHLKEISHISIRILEENICALSDEISKIFHGIFGINDAKNSM